MSPLEIRIALHYYAFVDDYRGEESRLKIDEICNDFVRRGLLRLATTDEHRRFVGTDALNLYVEALCNVPFPVQRWVIP